jgi:hypothetical protein
VEWSCGNFRLLAYGLYLWLAELARGGLNPLASDVQVARGDLDADEELPL